VQGKHEGEAGSWITIGNCTSHASRSYRCSLCANLLAFLKVGRNYGQATRSSLRRPVQRANGKLQVYAVAMETQQGSYRCCEAGSGPGVEQLAATSHCLKAPLQKM